MFSTELRTPRPADVVRLAGEAGLDAAALEGCLDDPKTKADLAAQIAEGRRLGSTRRPTLYINGKKLPRIKDFVAVVDKEARKKGFPPLSQWWRRGTQPRGPTPPSPPTALDPAGPRG